MGFPLEGNDDNGSFNDSGTQDFGGGNQGIHPAWNEVLEIIPQELHEKVVPYFQKQDGLVQQVHQKYSPYAKIAGDITPERLQQVLSVGQAIESNPKGFYEVLQRHLQSQGMLQQALEMAEEEEETGPQNIPPQVLQQMQQLQQQQEYMAQMMLEQRQKEQRQQEDAQLEALYSWMEGQSDTFKTLNSKKVNGVGFAESFVNDILERGGTPQQALSMLDQFVETAASYKSAPKAPVLLPGQGGGIVPQSQKKVTDLSDQETRGLVVEALKASFRNR